MKTEKRTKTYTSDYTVYITEDGQEFTRYYEAVKHERQLQAPRNIEKYEVSLASEEDYYIKLYHLLSQEDYDYAQIVDWEGGMRTGFENPGWYLVRKFSGGDYPDEYEMINVKDKISELEADLQTLKCLTNS